MLDAPFGKRFGQAQIRHGKIPEAWVREEHRVVLGAQAGRFEIVGIYPARFRMEDVGRNIVARSHLLGDDRPDTGELHCRVFPVTADSPPTSHENYGPLPSPRAVHPASAKQEWTVCEP